MTGLLDALAVALTAAGLVALAAGALGGAWRPGLAMALELWLAAGLLRLAAPPSWPLVATAAALVAVRRLLVRGLSRGAAVTQ